MAHATWEQIKKDKLASPEAVEAYERARAAVRLGNQIRELRESEGVTKSELARRIRTSPAAISRLEAGAAEARVSTLERIGEALDARLRIDFTNPAATLHKRTTNAPNRRGKEKSRAAG